MKSTILISLITCGITIKAQSSLDAPSGFTGGIEIGNHLTTSNGTFPAPFGFRFGYFSGFNILRWNNAAIYLPIEITYTSFSNYRLEVSHTWNDFWSQSLHSQMADEHFRISFVELAFGPQYSRIIAPSLVLSFYGHLFAGLGSARLKEINQLYYYVISDSVDNSFPTYTYGPYDAYKKSHVPVGYSVGLRILWHSFFIDSRFKRTYFFDLNRTLPNPESVFISFGYVL